MRHHEEDHPDADEHPRIDQRSGPIEQEPAHQRGHRRGDATGHQGQPGLGRSEVQQGLGEQGKDEHPAVEPEAEGDEQEDRGCQIAVLEHPEIDDGIPVSGRQLPPDHRHQADPGHQGKAQDPDVGEPILRVSLPPAPTAATPIPAVSKPMPTQSTRPRCRSCPGGSRRNWLTRNADAIPIGTLMKKHQLQE